MTTKEDILSKWFQSRKQDYFNWKVWVSFEDSSIQLFQSRKQDYFNWKNNLKSLIPSWVRKFQSRKQDYFNWKSMS